MRLFISYAHVNRAKVDELQALLEKAGNEVWFDHELAGGDNWWQRIVDEIKQADVFVFALSPQSTTSAACRVEFQYALNLNKPILPILLKEAELPIGRLQETQFVDARKLNSRETALAISRSLLNFQKQILSGAYPMPDPPPPPPTFPHESDPLKDVRERVNNLDSIPENEIVDLIISLKRFGRLGSKTAGESRRLLETIMHSRHISPTVAQEASDALKALPPPARRPVWLYAAAGIGGIIIIALVILLLVNRPDQLPVVGVAPTIAPTLAPSATPAPTLTPSVTPAPTETATPTVTFTPSPTPRVIPTPADGRTVITAANAAQIERLSLLGRGSPVRISWSPDGKTVAVSTYIGVWLYDHSTPDRPLRLLEGHTRLVEGVAFSPTGRILASASFDSTIRLWDVASGKPIGSPIQAYDSSGGYWARSVSFSPDEKLLAAGGCFALKVYDITDPEQPVVSISREAGCVNTVAFSPDGTQVVYGETRNSEGKSYPKVFDLKTGNQRSFGAHTDHIWSVVFSPDGNTLASAGGDKVIQLWDVESGGLLKQLDGHSQTTNSLIFTPDSKQIISGSDDNSIRIWDMETGQQIGEMPPGHSMGDLVIALNPDGTQLASISEDGTLRFWDVAKREAIGEPLSLFNTPGRGVVFSPDSRTLAASYYDGSVRRWDIEAGTFEDRGSSGGLGTTPITSSPLDANIIAADGSNNTVRLFNLTTGEELHDGFQRTGGDNTGGWVEGLAFSPDGKNIAAALSGNEDAIRIWPISGGVETVLRAPAPGPGDVYSVAFSPLHDDLLAAGYQDGTVMIWNLQTGESRFTLVGHTDNVWALAFSPDGKYLLSGSNDKSIRIWNVETGQTARPPLDNKYPVRSLAFSPDGTLLAAGLQLGDEIWLWDVTNITNPMYLLKLPAFASVFSVAFSPDGTLLAANGDAGAVGIWGIP